MKKRFLVAAMAAAMVSPFAANAEATVYGIAHVSINDQDSKPELDMTSNTSAIGVKGKEDLGGGMSALFKLEWQLDMDERNEADAGTGKNGLTDRDQWVGLKGAMGTVKFGTMSSNYKQMGGKVDPMYRTQLEGRSKVMRMQSRLHASASENGGRMTNTIQYSSPKMGGMQAVLNYTVSGSADETFGIGLRYQQKDMMAYVDYLDVQGDNGNAGIVAPGTSEAAIKIGGSFTMDALTLGLQFESTEDVTGTDILFLSADYAINDNDSVALTLGDVDVEDDMGYAAMYTHKFSKRTNVYVGYGDNASTDTALGSNDDQITTVGIRHKF